MSIRKNTLPTIDLSDTRYERPWHIDMEAFFGFSFDMSERLLDLEAQHLNPLPWNDKLQKLAAAQAQWM